MYGHRGVRVGEASHPGPPLLRQLCSGRSRGVPVEILSDEELLVHHVQKHVVRGLLVLSLGESLQLRPSEDVLDALEADLEVLQRLWPSDRFCGQNWSIWIHGGGDVEGFPMANEGGRGQVGQGRVVLVPAESGHAPICSGQGAPQHDASDDDPRQFWHCPEVGVISGEGAHLKVR